MSGGPASPGRWVSFLADEACGFSFVVNAAAPSLYRAGEDDSKAALLKIDLQVQFRTSCSSAQCTCQL